MPRLRNSNQEAGSRYHQLGRKGVVDTQSGTEYAARYQQDCANGKVRGKQVNSEPLPFVVQVLLHDGQGSLLQPPSCGVFFKSFNNSTSCLSPSFLAPALMASKVSCLGAEGSRLEISKEATVFGAAGVSFTMMKAVSKESYPQLMISQVFF